MPNSSNTPFTSPQLAAYFPTSNTAQTRLTEQFATQLLLDGTIDDAQFAQIASLVGAYLDTIAESYTLASAVYTGASGSTARKYRCVPTYPLPAQFNASLVRPPFEFMPSPPPQGYPNQTGNPLLANQFQPSNTYGGRLRLYGVMGPTTNLTAEVATLDASHYVTVTAPAASGHVTGTLFDILVQDAGTGDYNMIATGVAPSGVVVDTGLTRNVYAMYPNTTVQYLFKHAEVGYDSTASVGDGWNQTTVVYGLTTFCNPGFVT